MYSNVIIACGKGMFAKMRINTVRSVVKPEELFSSSRRFSNATKGKYDLMRHPFKEARVRSNQFYLPVSKEF